MTVPPLRERREDISTLCDLFLTQAAGDLKVPIRRISAAAMAILVSYDFPGNIRELKNLVERGCILSNSDEISAENFPVVDRTRTQDATDRRRKNL